MDNAKRILASCACGFFIACGDYTGGEKVAVTADEDGEASHSGSATDIVSAQGTGVDTNAAANENAADIGIGGPAQQSSGNYQSQPLPAQASDEELAGKIKVALTTGSMGTTGAIARDQLTEIDVRVQNGVVTLSGPVTSEAEKRSIEKRVADMNGVQSVNNQLTIGSRQGEQNSIDSRFPRSSGNE